MIEPLLEVRDLRVSFATDEGVVTAVDRVSFSVDRGEVVAIVGESGSGKSVTVMTLMGLTRRVNARWEGSARLNGRELLTLDEHELCEVRGGEIGMVFQNAMSALDPVLRIGHQIVEQIRAHDPGISRSGAEEHATQLLTRVGIPAARERLRAYPHQLSGGMRQRVMIAMALSTSPALMIMDEPTTALDVTVQAQIIDELRELRSQSNAGIILVTHDLGVVADIADRVVVMYAGRVVEEGNLDDLFYDPQHPYTWGLLGSITRMDRERPEILPAIAGTPPSPLQAPSGCHFRSRCPYAFDRCEEVPQLEGDAGHLDRCWLDPDEKRRLRLAGDRIGLGKPGKVTL